MVALCKLTSTQFNVPLLWRVMHSYNCGLPSAASFNFSLIGLFVNPVLSGKKIAGSAAKISFLFIPYNSQPFLFTSKSLPVSGSCTKTASFAFSNISL